MDSMDDIKILELLPGNRAIISTRGLRRVVIEPRGKVIGECKTIPVADAMAGSFNRCGVSKSRAVAVPYPDILEELVPTKRAKDMADLYNDVSKKSRAVVVPYKSKSAAKAKFRSAL
jgi:hypothetical protein